MSNDFSHLCLHEETGVFLFAFCDYHHTNPSTLVQFLVKTPTNQSKWSFLATNTNTLSSQSLTKSFGADSSLRSFSPQFLWIMENVPFSKKISKTEYDHSTNWSITHLEESSQQARIWRSRASQYSTNIRMPSALAANMLTWLCGSALKVDKKQTPPLCTNNRMGVFRSNYWLPMGK